MFMQRPVERHTMPALRAVWLDDEHVAFLPKRPHALNETVRHVRSLLFLARGHNQRGRNERRGTFV